jgi:hypothetical protein
LVKNKQKGHQKTPNRLLRLVQSFFFDNSWLLSRWFFPLWDFYIVKSTKISKKCSFAPKTPLLRLTRSNACSWYPSKFKQNYLRFSMCPARSENSQKIKMSKNWSVRRGTGGKMLFRRVALGSNGKLVKKGGSGMQLHI